MKFIRNAMLIILALCLSAANFYGGVGYIIGTGFYSTPTLFIKIFPHVLLWTSPIAFIFLIAGMCVRDGRRVRIISASIIVLNFLLCYTEFGQDLIETLERIS